MLSFLRILRKLSTLDFMCLICELSSTIELSSIPEYASITKNFETFGSKWGENQVPGSSGGAITYSFAAAMPQTNLETSVLLLLMKISRMKS